MEEVNRYYQNYDEENRLVKSKVHSLEFLTTTKFLDPLISTETSLLEVGAGTGRYSLHFLKSAKRVTAVDIFDPHVEQLRKKVQSLDPNEQSKINVVQANACDLSSFEDQSFDMVLCLGPFYHLKKEEERQKCLRELLRVLKSNGGVLALAYCNRMAMLIYDLSRFEREDYSIASLLKRGTETNNPFYFSSPSEIEAYARQLGIARLHHVATDGIGYILKTSVNALSSAGFEKWKDFHFQTCEDESTRGYSMHGLFIGQK
jgi:ubiquinone/menaquinone biosynthesis C-methylase UbiE